MSQECGSTTQRSGCGPLRPGPEYARHRAAAALIWYGRIRQSLQTPGCPPSTDVRHAFANRPATVLDFGILGPTSPRSGGTPGARIGITCLVGRRARPERLVAPQSAPGVPAFDLDLRADPGPLAVSVGFAGVVPRQTVDVAQADVIDNRDNAALQAHMGVPVALRQRGQ